MKRPRTHLLWIALLAVAAAVRLPSLPTGLPYMSYVDEGHVLHHVSHLLEERTWDPRFYIYPSLPFYVIALPLAAWSPVYAVLHDRPLRADLSPTPPRQYELLYPQDLIVAGRLVTLAFSLGLVLLTGLFARRLAGPAAGLFAAWLAALLPAFVIRSANANVNPMATFFSLAALVYAEGARDGDRTWRCAAFAGAMTGLATVSKYPAVLVCLPVALAIVFARRSWGERLRLLVVAGAASAVTAVAAMPALLLKPAAVLKQVRFQSKVYQRHVVGSYWDQAVRRAEWDLPLEHPELGLTFLILTAAGLAVALGDRRWRKPVLGWLLFALATFALFAQYRFRAFRNLLPLVPLACVLVALLYARLREALPPRPRLAVSLAAAALPVLLFAPALLQFSRAQLAVDDSREQAVRWLSRHTGPEHRVLFTEELGFLPHRIESLRAQTAVRPWGPARGRILRQRFHYVVVPGFLDPAGLPLISPQLAEKILRRYEIATRFGSKPPFQIRGRFKGNEQLICILKKKPAAADR
jgi:hypothetical protein